MYAAVVPEGYLWNFGSYDRWAGGERNEGIHPHPNPFDKLRVGSLPSTDLWITRRKTSSPLMGED